MSKEHREPSLETVRTIQEDGSRFYIHPVDTKGFFTTLRKVVALLLIGIYIALPWIPVQGNPAVFLDILHRRFYLFGYTFIPQDVWLLFFVITGLGFALFYITALFGRIWCGWACPQTIFLEHVYRRIERLIEGDGMERRRLHKLPWHHEERLPKFLIKHFLFFFVSFLIAHIFLSYYVSIPELYNWMQNSPSEHWGAFVFMIVITLVLHGNFGWFREQLCMIICPYGRLQSALIDDNSVVIGYDEKRGEPRGKATDPNAGDCVDCHKCIEVCPTGIDIRNGLQLECVGCSACIDACDGIMDKLKRPKGLIRYGSKESLEGRKTKWIRPRTILYTFLLCIGIGVMMTSLQKVGPAHANVLRMKGAPYYVTDQFVRNQFTVRVVNKMIQTSHFSVSVANLPEHVEVRGIDSVIEVERSGESARTVVVTVDRNAFKGDFELDFRVRLDERDYEMQIPARFIGPDPRLLNEEI